MTCVKLPAEEFILSWPVLNPIYLFMTNYGPNLSFQDCFWFSIIHFWKVFRSILSFPGPRILPWPILNPIYPFLKGFEAQKITWKVLEHICPLLNCSKTLLTCSLMVILKMFLDNSLQWEYKLVPKSRMCVPLTVLFFYTYEIIYQFTDNAITSQYST
jgi:hypothetical protein